MRAWVPADSRFERSHAQSGAGMTFLVRLAVAASCDEIG